MKILIAEDNAFSRTLLEKALQRAGYEVVAVESGDAAWEVLQEDDRPQLAIVDWMMPGMSGVELCRRIRESDSTVPTYVVLLTAKTDKADVIEGFSAGADDFIKKPFDSGEVVARMLVGRRLVEQQALLGCLLDSIPDPIYVKNGNGVYLGCNKAYAEFVGVDSRGIHSSSSFDVLPPDRAKELHLEDLRVLADGEVVETEGWVTNAAGESVYHSTLKTPYLESAAGSTGMIGISRDLTSRMLMEQELKHLAVVVEQSAESILITDVKGKILYLNAAFEAMTGYSSIDAVGSYSNILKSGKHADEFYSSLWKTISSGDVWEKHLVNRRKDGTLYEEEKVIYPIRNSDRQVVNYVSISHDVTQEIALEKQLRQQQKMNAIGELAGGVSHDFNNILTAILGYVALCMNSVDDGDKVFGYLQEIVKAGERAANLVRQILTFSRQEEQEFHAMELQPIIADMLNMVHTTIKANISVEVDVDPSCGEILGDVTQLQQVFLNLCTNAIHALGVTESGVLSVSLQEVNIPEGRKDDPVVDMEPGGYVCMVVRDTGCGMPSEVVERMFEPYFTTKDKGEGTGFGLSIVHGIVRKHRGIISVDSEEGKGTTFRLYFPLIAKEGTPGQPQLNPSAARSSDVGLRVLFVDDDSTIRAMGNEMLKSFGYDVVVASDALQALDLLKQDPDGFDALVTDYSMREMNGYELIREAYRVCGDIPTFLCSGYMEKIVGENLEELDLSAYVGKPIDWQALNQLITDAIAE